MSIGSILRFAATGGTLATPLGCLIENTHDKPCDIAGLHVQIEKSQIALWEGWAAAPRLGVGPAAGATWARVPIHRDVVHTLKDGDLLLSHAANIWGSSRHNNGLHKIVYLRIVIIQNGAFDWGAEP